MDYAKINEFSGKAKSHTQVVKSNSVRVSSKRVRNRSKELVHLSSTFDLSMVTEEVVEAVFASQSYRVSHNRIDDGQSSPTTISTIKEQTMMSSLSHDTNRKFVLVILDIPQNENWTYSMPVGAWRRVLM
jgi:uncharacterized lipoprotein YajG